MKSAEPNNMLPGNGNLGQNLKNEPNPFMRDNFDTPKDTGQEVEPSPMSRALVVYQSDFERIISDSMDIAENSPVANDQAHLITWFNSGIPEIANVKIKGESVTPLFNQSSQLDQSEFGSFEPFDSFEYFHFDGPTTSLLHDSIVNSAGNMDWITNGSCPISSIGNYPTDSSSLLSMKTPKLTAVQNSDFQPSAVIVALVAAAIISYTVVRPLVLAAIKLLTSCVKDFISFSTAGKQVLNMGAESIVNDLKNFESVVPFMPENDNSLSIRKMMRLVYVDTFASTRICNRVYLSRQVNNTRNVIYSIARVKACLLRIIRYLYIQMAENCLGLNFRNRRVTRMLFDAEDVAESGPNILPQETDNIEPLTIQDGHAWKFIERILRQEKCFLCKFSEIYPLGIVYYFSAKFSWQKLFSEIADRYTDTSLTSYPKSVVGSGNGNCSSVEVSDKRWLVKNNDSTEVRFAKILKALFPNTPS